MSELRSLQPQLVSECTVSGVQGSLTLTTDMDCSAKFAADDLILVGDTTTTYKVASDTNAAITLAAGEELKKAYPAGTAVYLQPAYGLWDADKNRACKCDARYSGYDCSERKCPVGDDPMTVDQQFETQILTIGGAAPQNYVGGLNSKLVGTTGIKLVFEDMYGEKWTTTQIPVDGIVDHTADVASALTALPNEIIQGVTVTFDAISTVGIRYYIKFNGGTTGPKACSNRKCPSYTSTGNSGDLPTMGCDNSELLVRVEGAAIGGAGTVASGVLTFATALTDTASLQVGDLLAFYTSGSAAWMGDGTVASITISATPEITAITVTTKMSFETTNTAVIKPVRYVKGGVECTVSDIALIQPATWAAAYETGAATANTYTFTFTNDVTANSVAIGDQLYLYKDRTQSQIVTVADRVGAVITTVEEITAAYTTSEQVYFYGKGTTEKKECSGRGLCDVGSGQCKCFAGYTMDDCSRQSALAK